MNPELGSGKASVKVGTNGKGQKTVEVKCYAPTPEGVSVSQSDLAMLADHEFYLEMKVSASQEQMGLQVAGDPENNWLKEWEKYCATQSGSSKPEPHSD